ncbi:MAG: hypothetical protein MRK00_05830 [Nitrosomonas sp.]|nr:hypothetical protein [Nitrosomonas sp.]
MPNDELMQLELSGFDHANTVNWIEHPNVTINRRDLLDTVSMNYIYDHQKITVDISNHNEIQVNNCGSGTRLDNNFFDGDPLLRTTRNEHRVIMLTFEPAVLAVGAHISVDARMIGEEYWGQLRANFSAQKGLIKSGISNKIRGTAPFLGGKAPAGKLIDTVTFDAYFTHSETAPHLSDPATHIAINTLHYIPQ